MMEFIYFLEFKAIEAEELDLVTNVRMFECNGVPENNVAKHLIPSSAVLII